MQGAHRRDRRRSVTTKKTPRRMKEAAAPAGERPANRFCDICLAAPSGPVRHSLRLLQRRVQRARSGPGIQTRRLPGPERRFLRLCRSRGPLLDGLFHLPALLQEHGPRHRVTPQVGTPPCYKTDVLLFFYLSFSSSLSTITETLFVWREVLLLSSAHSLTMFLQGG